MIDIIKDKKSDCFILTQTTRIEGIDYHKQLTLTRKELAEIADYVLTQVNNDLTRNYGRR